MTTYRFTMFEETCSMTFKGKMLTKHEFTKEFNCLEDALFFLLDDKFMNFHLGNSVKLDIVETSFDGNEGKEAVREDKDGNYYLQRF